MKSDLEKLRAIVEASKKLTSTLDLDELLNVILDVALTELEAERGTVFLLDEDKNEVFSRILRGNEISEIRLKVGKGIAGKVAETGETIIIDDAYSDDRFDPNFDRQTGFKTQSILSAPLMDGDEIVGVLQLLNQKRGRFTSNDAEYLSALAAHMVIAINNARAHHERLEQEKTKKELELAASIQQNLLPEGPPRCNGLQIESYYQPCREVGGDIFDFMYLPDDRLGIVLADVSGKGVPAALITSALHAYLHALVEHYSSPAEFCNVLNRLMCGSLPQASYATMVFIEFDPANGSVRYCNCGHLPILFINDNTVDSHGPTGTVMGLMPKASYKDNTVTLPPGGKLLLYTDGLTEASPDEEEEVEEPREFSLKRLQEICAKARGDHSDLLELLKSEVDSFTEGTQQRDDMTMLSMQYRGE